MSALHLRTTLEEFRKDFSTREDPRERLTITVDREASLQNLARTATSKTILLDEPSDFGGLGQAPDPAEYLLAAAGASLSVTLTVHAALEGLEFRWLKQTITGVIDGDKFFDPAAPGTAGIYDITIDLDVGCASSRESFERVLDRALSVTPVLQTFRLQPAVRVSYHDTRTTA